MILPLAVAFVILLLMATPVSIAMGLASVFAILVTGKVPLNTVVTQMVAGMDSFPLMAIPFFILAGELMERGGSRNGWWPWPRPWWAILRVDWGWS